MVDPSENLASPIRRNVVFPKPLHEGGFSEVFYILSNVCVGQ